MLAAAFDELDTARCTRSDATPTSRLMRTGRVTGVCV